jgi:hypothetical protein
VIAARIGDDVAQINLAKFKMFQTPTIDNIPTRHRKVKDLKNNHRWWNGLALFKKLESEFHNLKHLSEDTKC